MASSYSPRHSIEEFLGSLRRFECHHNFPPLCVLGSYSAFWLSLSKSNGYMSSELQVFDGIFRAVVSLYEPHPRSASPYLDILVTKCRIHDLPQRTRCASQDVRLKLLHRLRYMQSPHHMDVGEPNLQQVGLAVSVYHHHGVRRSDFQSSTDNLLRIRMIPQISF